MKSMVHSSSTRTMSLAHDTHPNLIDELDSAFDDEPEMDPKPKKAADKVIHAKVKKPDAKGKRASAHSMVAGSFTGGGVGRKNGLVYKRQASNNNRLQRSSSRNSRNIN